MFNTAVLAAAAAPGNTLQYDYSSLLLNSSSMVRKPIPRPDAQDDPAYKVRTNAVDLQLQLAAVHAYSCITHLPPYECNAVKECSSCSGQPASIQLEPV